MYFCFALHPLVSGMPGGPIYTVIYMRMGLATNEAVLSQQLPGEPMQVLAVSSCTSVCILIANHTSVTEHEGAGPHRSMRLESSTLEDRYRGEMWVTLTHEGRTGRTRWSAAGMLPAASHSTRTR